MPKPLILCVDAEQNTLDLLSNALSTAGYLVRTAHLGANALTAGDTPDLVILDLTLPDISGFQQIEGLREYVPQLLPVFPDMAADKKGVVLIHGVSPYPIVFSFIIQWVSFLVEGYLPGNGGKKKFPKNGK